MSEFTIHHDVMKLMTKLGVQSSAPLGAEEYAEELLKHRTPYVTTQMSSSQAKRDIAKTTETPIEFFAKYDDLKSLNMRELDPLVHLLSKINKVEEVKYVVRQNASAQAEKEGFHLGSHKLLTSQLPTPGSRITEKELSEVGELLKRATAVDNPPADFLTTVLREKPLNRNVNLPELPDWFFSGLYPSNDYQETIEEENVLPLENLPVFSQEQAVMEDLLNLMMGRQGKYIRQMPLSDKYSPRQFLIDQSLDISTQALVQRVLPLFANYSTITRFTDEKTGFEYGLVNQALAEAMMTLMKDFWVLVAQLEKQLATGQLTLQKMCFYLEPTMNVFDILGSVANSINKWKCIGGAVLSLLHEKTASLIGDSESSKILLFLTQSACVPYMRLVEKWIYKGIIADPYAEFFVEENETISKEKLQEEYNDAYWDKHYSVFQERIPVFLDLAADKILNAGKYLNVVRQSGRDVRCPHAEDLVYAVKERRYHDQIERAYRYASQLLLSLLMEEKELIARLKSIKNYFLLEKGDFIVQYMDMTELEMKQDVDDIRPSRLESLLDLALRSSTANADNYKDDLRVDLLPYDVTSQLLHIIAIDSKKELEDCIHPAEYRADPTDIRLSGLEAFTFDYVVKWPTSLVISRKALIRYQIMFRHLFYCKHVERQLCGVWVGNKQSKAYTSSRWHTAAFALRHRMLNFVQNFEHYMMFEVIEPNWHYFLQNLATVSNVDDVLAFHEDFLDCCLKDCMLTSTELLRIVNKLMVVCVTFSNYVQRVNQATTVEVEQERLRVSTLQTTLSNAERKEDAQKKKTATKVLAEHVDQVLADQNFEQTIQTFEKNFTRYLLQLFDKIMDENRAPHEHKLFNLIYRMDFNGFYAEKLEAISVAKAMRNTSMKNESKSSKNSSKSSSCSSLASFTMQQPESAHYVPGHYKSKDSGSAFIQPPKK